MLRLDKMIGFRQSGRGKPLHARPPTPWGLKMFERFPALFRSCVNALRGGFLVRPLAIALVLGAAGAVLSSLEESFYQRGRPLDTNNSVSVAAGPGCCPDHSEQHSHVNHDRRVNRVRDPADDAYARYSGRSFPLEFWSALSGIATTQWTLGIFLGTFSYCTAALPAARALPHPFVPAATVSGAMLLALGCVGWLIYFHSPRFAVNQRQSHRRPHCT